MIIEHCFLENHVEEEIPKNNKKVFSTRNKSKESKPNQNE